MDAFTKHVADAVAAHAEYRTMAGPCTYADREGVSNGDLDVLELIDGRSYKLQCRSASRTRGVDFCMGEGLLTHRS